MLQFCERKLYFVVSEMNERDLMQSLFSSTLRRNCGHPSVILVAKKHVRQKCDLEIDTLECPICTEAFSPPVYQVLTFPCGFEQQIALKSSLSYL